MNSTTSPIQSITLSYREGSSDKVYQVSINETGSGFTVDFAYGRRGSTLKTGSKTSRPVSREEADKIFARLVKSKESKGYRAGDDETSYVRTSFEERDSGIRCQLLNPVDEAELTTLLSNTTHCLQEKLDGQRLMIRKVGDTITGINRRGLVTTLPETVVQACQLLPLDFLLDGEAMGDSFHAFDILELDGHDLRSQGFIARHSCLMRMLPPGLEHLRWVSAVVDPRDKYEAFHDLLGEGKEGVVFKDSEAPYTPGRPASGGSQLKHKFQQTASFLVTGHNRKRSVSLGLRDESGKLKPAGNVTIPTNHDIPATGTIVEVRYLYAYPQSGAIYQPLYLGPRNDIPAEDCTTRQLKYKDAQPPSH